MRYLAKTIDEFSKSKMVWLSGPRQVGKTFLSKQWLQQKEKGLYLSWDAAADRTRLLRTDFLEKLQTSALVLDEIHKYLRWKSWLKGIYDKRSPLLEILVTGSAKLNVFHRGGDSLLGRYELLRLHPFSMGELTHGTLVAPPTDWLAIGGTPSYSAWLQLDRCGGFPEPFTKDDPLQHRRWSSRRRDLLINEDLRELSQIHSLSLVEQLAVLLGHRIGSPLSLQSLREELQVSHDTVRLWVEQLERLYYCYRISPFHKKLSRALKKEQKLYLWDWSTIEDPGARFENMVASHLLKSVHAWNDLGYGDFDLQFMRDAQKREIDFVITERQHPVAFIECKYTETALSPSLVYIGQFFPSVPCIQLVHAANIDIRKDRYRVVSAASFLAGLT